MPSAQAIRAGAAYVELYTKDSRLVRGLARASKRLQAFGAGVRAMGLRVAAAGAAMLAPLLGAAKLFASTGDQLDKMRARTGFSAQALSELGFAAEQGGASIDQLDRSLAAMARFSVMVERGLKTSTDLLDMLGVSVEQFKQASPEERFKLLAEAISKIEDPSLRAGIALNVFGRSGRELLPMLAGGRASIEALQEEARRLGITMTDEDATSAAELTDALNRLKRQLQAIVVQIGAALAPVLTEMQKNIAPLISSAIKWIKENKTLVVTIFKIAAAVVAAGVGLIILGTLISSIGAVIGGLVAVIGAVGTAIAILGKIIALLLTPIGLVVIAVVALAGYLLYATGLGGKALAWLGERFQVLKDDALAAWKGISDALAAGDIGLAAKILWLTLKMEWKRGIHFLNGLWIKAKTFFLTLWTDAVYGLAKIINDAWAGIEVAWAETVGFLADAWSVFTNLLTKSWHTTVGFIKKAWVRLKSLFDEDVDVDAEVNRINRETSEANATADNKMLEAVGQRDRERRERRAQIERDRAGAEETLTQMQQEEHARRQRGFAEDLAGTESELADARREWQEAIAEAAKKRAEAESGEPERLKELQDDLSFSGSALGEEERKVEVKGTFNALAARGLGADSLAERTARAAEQIVVNTKDLLDEAKQGKLVFAQQIVMPITIDEKFDSREATESESPTTELLYVVQGTDDDLLVKSLVAATAPAIYDGLKRDSFSIKTLGGGVWECAVQYVKFESESQFTFDTGGGTQHISQAIETINRYPALGEVAPDFQSAIGVNQDQIEGTDITVPVYNFTETHYIDDSLVTGAYKATLFFLTGRVNDAGFKGFAKGEVLFLGASGAKRGFEDWEITFRFAASPNVAGLQLGNIAGIDKEGWHYLWVRFADEEDNAAKVLIKKPIAAYVERVYEYGDFSGLGIGT